LVVVLDDLCVFEEVFLLLGGVRLVLEEGS
jgi:hypothetical protein